MPPLLRVALPVPLYRSYDYLAPAHVDPVRLPAGIRLRVPFGHGNRIGLLLGTKEHSDIEPSRLKPALELIDASPLLGPLDLQLLGWAADYYQHPLGEVIFSALPPGLRKGKPLSEARAPGWRITNAGAEVSAQTLKRAPRQAQILDLLKSSPDGLSREQIYARCAPCAGTLRNLAAKGWLETCPLPETITASGGTPPPPILSPSQRAAVERISRTLHGFHTYLLDGVTGSGKTEVYLTLVERHLAAGQQILILVPEIALTPQLLRRFRSRIQAPVGLLHSGLSTGERERAWQDARSGRARVLLGTRSCVFTPMPDLGLVVVDEEHDLSFKQQDGFRYSARDLAVIRARQRQCPAVLGSATPALESLRNSATGRYTRLVLPERAGAARPPSIDLLDIRSVHLIGGMSPALLRFMRETLTQNHQVLLFLNRRGYAPVMICHDCGWLSECPRCDARMTLHREAGLLWCHHCGHQRRPPEHCPECGRPDLRLLGQGTERLMEVLRELFPTLAIARIDRDSTSRKGALERLLAAIRNGDYQILLGTQMLAKGHHFPNVTLVGILDVDQGLFGSDYRAPERIAQQLTQVAGRAGRAKTPGRVLIQTRHPDHPLLQTLIHKGYHAFAQQALAERSEARLPPYWFQALLRAESTRAEDPAQFLENAAQIARSLAEPRIELWGPVPAPMEKRAGRFRAHLLLQAPERRALQRLLSGWLPKIDRLQSSRRVRWSIDVDPQEML